MRRSILSFKWEQRYVAALHFKHYQDLRNHSGIHSLQPFDQYECIFIHIPKNGGISVANGLFGQGRMLGGHYSNDFYRIIFGEEFNHYFKFAITRNPWDRLVSAFHYLKGGGLDFRDVAWERKHISQYNDFSTFVDSWVCSKNVKKGMHFIPQSEFICDTEGKIVTDYIGRFECIDHDFANLAKKLKIKNARLLHSNQSKRRKDYRFYYSDEQAKRVESVYAADIKAFGYQYDKPFS